MGLARRGRTAANAERRGSHGRVEGRQVARPVQEHKAPATLLPGPRCSSISTSRSVGLSGTPTKLEKPVTIKRTMAPSRANLQDRRR